MRTKATTNLKAREVQFIHIAKTQLAMDDETYRAMLRNLAGVSSSKDLSDEGRAKVIKHLKTCGASIAGHRPGKDHKPLAETKQAIEKKIGVQLAKLDKPWSYAYGTAKKICPGVARFEFLSVEQLQKVSGALDRTIKFAAKKAEVSHAAKT
jgi:phage gp16-like protein